MKNDIYDRYVSTHLENFCDTNNLKKAYGMTYLRWKDYYSKFLPCDKNSKILEIGCGLGHHLCALNRLGYKNISGIDVSNECIDICQKNGFDAILSDCFDYLSKTDEKFSVILLFDVFEHFKKDDALNLLKLIYNRLEQNGVCIIKTVNASNPFSLNVRYGDMTHEVVYNEDSICQIFKLNNFVDINIFPLYNFSVQDFTIFGTFKRRLGMISCNLIWKLFRLAYYMQGIRSPRILSTSLLAIGIKRNI